MFNGRKIQFYRVLLPIILRKTLQRRGITYDVIDELQRQNASLRYVIIYLWNTDISLHKPRNVW